MIARDAPMINHLMFADDCLIFIKAELGQLGKLKDLLCDYERLAGQRVNYNKFEIIGSGSIDENMLRLCAEVMDMRVVGAL